MRANLPAALGRVRDDLKVVRLDLSLPGAERGKAHEGRDAVSVLRRILPLAAALGRGVRRLVLLTAAAA
jgi:hypothetical protein